MCVYWGRSVCFFFVYVSVFGLFKVCIIFTKIESHSPYSCVSYLFSFLSALEHLPHGVNTHYHFQCLPKFHLHIITYFTYIFLNFFLNYWSIVDLQCVNFCCTANDSLIHIYILFHILFHYGLSQDIEYTSLCNTVESCLSIKYIMVCFC